ncbi:hypothetical protein PGTUg99_031451 [Puccinia graminis f. sp. tritici]|uniref:RING-type domain-containing protein n=2 Tax=Puccinia graminis f. sp. tritici TaxID=56615 RepID=E3L7C6_PUCGT|nr:uncharacterized protein PGTG_18276 [Puccinia graminis f. sp. tritici CRL 75-36-700-3]XP_003338134.2 uncharacterized protein PGTG_19684 [Puccinia graminis f. sp. tritici CRL 75-36-700-3]EFP92451.1 hypothetical protein PGTG_18276 [Puccinia graminis f. sp. tritici CRL 75-36-700-3]EFP93715.2 hypothetical protein PGTG_19684 [Puccinia graminis f. sp. tritici CRL 75-36-700-3]KAA1122168.1 hypothetical protein PGTUg99_031451 [Puccinia graminis f. sp. tritici]
MTTNPTPSDSESSANQSGASPGGVPLVEESVEPRASSTPEPQVNPEQNEAPASPQTAHADHAFGEDWIQLPDEFNSGIMALLGQLQGPLALELDEAGGPRLPQGQDEPAFAQNALELVRLLQAMPQAAPAQPAQIDETAWVEMLQTLTPEQRLIVEGFENRTITVRRELVNSPAQDNNRMVALREFLDHLEELRRILANLPRETARMIERFYAEAHREIDRLMDNPDHIAAARQNIDPLLDSLINTNLTSLSSDVPQHDSTKCTVCLEEYAESDVIVVLPCHPTHHFDRRCIHDWLQTLVPGPPTCPNCRAPIVFQHDPAPPPQ